MNQKVEKFYDKRQIYTNIQSLGKVKKLALQIRKSDSADIYKFKDLTLLNLPLKQML